MLQNKTTCTIAKKSLAALIALLLMLGCCGAHADTYEFPSFGEHRTDATLEDFVGIWTMRWIVSEEPVDLRTYGYLEIYQNGSVSVNFGDNSFETYYRTKAEEAKDGCIYIPNENGTNGIYLFLFENDMMGCTVDLEKPAEVMYMEFDSELDEERPEYEIIADLIVSHIGAQVFEAAQEDYAGHWHAFSYINDSTRLKYLYKTGTEMEIAIEGDQAEITYNNGAEETSYSTPVTYESDCAVILDEYGEKNLYLVLNEEGDLILLDNATLPESATFFMTPERYEEAMSDVNFNANPQPGKQVEIESLDSLTGDWTATHIKYGGTLYPIEFMSSYYDLTINDDGSILMTDDNDTSDGSSRIEDGVLAVSIEDESDSYFLYFEGDILIQTENPGDLSFALYFQRADGSV